eukprot:Nk52_evm113s914 gene=Nk52_evmTU113s914
MESIKVMGDLEIDNVSLPSLYLSEDGVPSRASVSPEPRVRTSVLIDVSANENGEAGDKKEQSFAKEVIRKSELPSSMLVGNKLAAQTLRMRRQSKSNLDRLCSNQYDQILQLLPSAIFDDIQANNYNAGRLEAPVEILGALMIADVSGFSSLSSLLEKDSGSLGADTMSQFLNKYFGYMIEIIESYGGDVLKFAGDALVCMFKEREGYSAENVCRSACEAGLQLIEQLTNFKVEDGTALSLHVGVTYGRFFGLHLGRGANFRRCECITVGCSLSTFDKILDSALPGEIAVDEGVREVLGESAVYSGPFTDDRHEILQQNCTQILAGFTDKYIFEPAELSKNLVSTGWIDQNITALQEYIVRPVQQIISAKLESSWLNEIRTVTIVFAGFRQLDPSRKEEIEMEMCQYVLNHLDFAFSEFVRCIHRRKGTVLQAIADDKGISFIAAFGIPPFSHADDVSSAVLSCMEFKHSLMSNSLYQADEKNPLRGFSIGVSTGKVFAGILGSTVSGSYTLIGDRVNLAARLMKQPRAIGNVVCDLRTKKDSEGLITYEFVGKAKVKGKVEPVELYVPIGNACENKEEEVETQHSKVVNSIRNIIDCFLYQKLVKKGVILAAIGPPNSGKSTIMRLLLNSVKKSFDILREDGVENTCLFVRANREEKKVAYGVVSHIFCELIGVDCRESMAERERHILDFYFEALFIVGDKLHLLNEMLLVSFENDKDCTFEKSDEKCKRQDLKSVVMLLQIAVLIRKKKNVLMLIIDELQWVDGESFEIIIRATLDIHGWVTVVCCSPFECTSMYPNFKPFLSSTEHRDRVVELPLEDIFNFHMVNYKLFQDMYAKDQGSKLPERNRKKWSLSRNFTQRGLWKKQSFASFFCPLCVGNRVDPNLEETKISTITSAKSSMVFDSEVHAFDKLDVILQVIAKTASIFEYNFNLTMLLHCLEKSGVNVSSLNELSELAKILVQQRIFTHLDEEKLHLTHEDSLCGICTNLDNEDMWFRFAKPSAQEAIYGLVSDTLKISIHQTVFTYVDSLYADNPPNILLFIGHHMYRSRHLQTAFNSYYSALVKLHELIIEPGTCIADGMVKNAFSLNSVLAQKCILKCEEILGVAFKGKSKEAISYDRRFYVFLCCRTYFLLGDWPMFKPYGETMFNLFHFKRIANINEQKIVGNYFQRKNIRKKFKKLSEGSEIVNTKSKEPTQEEKRIVLFLHDYAMLSLYNGVGGFKFATIVYTALKRLHHYRNVSPHLAAGLYASMASKLTSRFQFPLANRLMMKYQALICYLRDNGQLEFNAHRFALATFFKGVVFFNKGMYRPAVLFMSQLHPAKALPSHAVDLTLALIWSQQYTKATNYIKSLYSSLSKDKMIMSSQFEMICLKVFLQGAICLEKESAIQYYLHSIPDLLYVKNKVDNGTGISPRDVTNLHLRTLYAFGVNATLALMHIRLGNVTACCELLPTLKSCVDNAEKKSFLSYPLIAQALLYFVEILIRLWINYYNDMEKSLDYSTLFKKYFKDAKTFLGKNMFQQRKLKLFEACQLFLEKRLHESLSLFDHILTECEQNNDAFALFDICFYHCNFMYHPSEENEIERSEKISRNLSAASTSSSINSAEQKPSSISRKYQLHRIASNGAAKESEFKQEISFTEFYIGHQTKRRSRKEMIDLNREYIGCPLLSESEDDVAFQFEDITPNGLHLSYLFSNADFGLTESILQGSGKEEILSELSLVGKSRLCYIDKSGCRQENKFI